MSTRRTVLTAAGCACRFRTVCGTRCSCRALSSTLRWRLRSLWPWPRRKVSRRALWRRSRASPSLLRVLSEHVRRAGCSFRPESDAVGLYGFPAFVVGWSGRHALLEPQIGRLENVFHKLMHAVLHRHDFAVDQVTCAEHIPPSPGHLTTSQQLRTVPPRARHR
jgi:hypothetical protein